VRGRRAHTRFSLYFGQEIARKPSRKLALNDLHNYKTLQMEKRYQVFISSTFEDLKIERQNVLKAILEIDNMPAGMELFPAADSDAWELIKDVIDASDYYVLVIGGRYGSLNSEGISYTEKEYDYAVEKKKPVIPLLHKKPDNLPRGKTETDPKAWSKLVEFIKKVENAHTCVYWENPDELKSLLIVGLTKIIKKKPAIGWVKADRVSSEETLKEILDLRRKNQELENVIKTETFSSPEGTENLVQGEDEFEINCAFNAKIPDDKEYLGYKRMSYTGKMFVTWNKIWAAISPSMINEASSDDLKNSFNNFLSKTGREIWEGKGDLKDATLSSFRFENDIYDTVFVQFRALGLMKESIKQRSVKDINTYWTLTRYGDNLMMKLRALKRDEEEKKTKGKKTKSNE